MGRQVRGYISFIMVIVVFAFSASGFCRNADAAELCAGSDNIGVAGYAGVVDTDCPHCPVDEHSVPSHCDSSCSCHMPPAGQPVKVVCDIQTSLLKFFYPFKALPEVFLPRFIPPHIPA